MAKGDRIFLAASHAKHGQINYVQMMEPEGKADDLKTVGGWMPLVTGLKYPTYTAYDFSSKRLYVCDCDQILQYTIMFPDEVETGEQVIITMDKQELVNGVYCGGLELDKFGNLFYVDLVSFNSSNDTVIRKINRDILLAKKKPVDKELQKIVYSGKVSSSVSQAMDVAIEQEYLYWTNDSHEDGHGGIHKAFTEPWIKAEPFQTYEIKDVARAFSITTNENYLFFTG